VEDSLSPIPAGDVVSSYRHRPSVIIFRGLGYSGKGGFGGNRCLAARFVTSEKSSAIARFFRLRQKFVSAAASWRTSACIVLWVTENSKHVDARLRRLSGVGVARAKFWVISVVARSVTVDATLLDRPKGLHDFELLTGIQVSWTYVSVG
jgi:hypothetical protein